MPPLFTRRSSRPLGALLGATILLGACGSGSQTELRTARVYEAVVRWFADRAPDDREPLPIFVEPKGVGTSIDLEVQAALIARTERVAAVRFIDARDEALGVSGDGRVVVRNGGILIRLGPVPESGDRVTVDVDLWVSETTMQAYRIDLARRDEVWEVEGTPVHSAAVPSG